MRNRLTHMPLYFTLLLTYQGDHTHFSLRLPSALGGLLTIAMTMRVLTHIYGVQRYALLAGLILCIQSYIVLQARTARMYSIGNFLVVTASYLFFLYISAPQDNKPNVHRFLFYIVSMFAYLTHLSTLVLIPAQLLILC